MRRFFLLFVLIVTLSRVNVAAQETDDTKPMWGIMAAFDINIPGKWHFDGESVEMFRHGFGGIVGGVCDIDLGHDFYLEPGVSIFYDTYSYKNMVIAMDPREEIDPTVYRTGIRVPVVAGYSFDITDRYMMSVYTGPEVSYVFKGGIRGKYIDHNNNEDLGEILNPYARHGMHRKFDCAWKIGLAFPTEFVTLTFDAAIGITDVCKNDISMRENRVSIGLAHYF